MYQSTKIDGKIIVYVYHYGAIRWRLWLCTRIVFSSVTIITNSRLPDVYSHSSIYRIFYLIFSYFIKKGCTVRQTTSHCQVLTVISDKKAQNVRQITASSLPVFKLKISTFSWASIPAELYNTCDYTTDAILLTTQFWILYCIFDTLNDLKWKGC